MEKISLYFKEGSSDKVYSASIEPIGNQYLVHFAYGRRGSTLQTGSKTSTPVDYAQAKGIFDKLIKEKMAKGYTQGVDGEPYQHVSKTNSGILPQLLNSLDENKLAMLLTENGYVMQEKFDGRRLLIQKQGQIITGINKLGFTVGLPSILEQEMQGAQSDFIIDGEIIGENYHVFDLLSLDGSDYKNQSYRVRYLALMNLIASFQHRQIHLVDLAFTPFQKGILFDQIKSQGKEGVVFKWLDAPYTPGRPNRGGAQLKFKFCESASFIVTKINEKRSVSLSLYNGDVTVPAGNCTIPPNHEIPEPGSIIECRYLYAFRESGLIFQPVYLGKRDDITPEECSVDQLKYKPEARQAA